MAALKPYGESVPAKREVIGEFSQDLQARPVESVENRECQKGDDFL